MALKRWLSLVALAAMIVFGLAFAPTQSAFAKGGPHPYVLTCGTSCGSGFNNTDPIQTGCSNTATIPTANPKNPNSNDGNYVWLRKSTSCSTYWVKAAGWESFVHFDMVLFYGNSGNPVTEFDCRGCSSGWGNQWYSSSTPMMAGLWVSDNAGYNKYVCAAQPGFVWTSAKSYCEAAMS